MSSRTTDVIKRNVKISGIYEPETGYYLDISNVTTQNIARVVDVYGITSNPEIQQKLTDPTPEDPIGDDFWRFNRRNIQSHVEN